MRAGSTDLPALVLDASVAVGFLLPDEAPRAAREVLSRISRDGALVPATWPVEVGNSLLIQNRRGRLTMYAVDAGLARLTALEIEVDLETSDGGWRRAIPLAIRHHLTLYDAVYLELALRAALPLATFDKALRRAAEAAGVPLANPPA